MTVEQIDPCKAEDRGRADLLGCVRGAGLGLPTGS